MFFINLLISYVQMTIFAPIFNTIDVSKYRCFLFDVSYPSMVATDVNTDIEHRCLCSMSHPYCIHICQCIINFLNFFFWFVSSVLSTVKLRTTLFNSTCMNIATTNIGV
jgi:hypothetical protein